MVVTVTSVITHQLASAQTPCKRFYKTRTATISATGGGTAKVVPDQACIAIGGTIKWKATSADSWATDFTDDAHTPFAVGKTHHEAKDAQTSGDPVRACAKSDPTYDAAAAGCVFKYKATHKKGAQTSVIDPKVIVQPGT